jgi:hypothetical protein
MGKHTTEFVLGLIGGILGIFGSLIALAVGGFGGAVGAEGATTVIGLGWLGILFSVIGIVGSALVKSKLRLGGALMTVSAIGGVVSISFAYIPSFILLIIAGLMGLFKKKR